MMEYYDEFKEEYMDTTIPVKQLEDKYGVHGYRKLRRLVKEKTGYIRKAGRKTGGKYYYWQDRDQKWIVVRRINGVKTEFGSYSDENTAQKIVDLLHRFNWDKTLLPDIKVMAYG